MIQRNQPSHLFKRTNCNINNDSTKRVDNNIASAIIDLSTKWTGLEQNQFSIKSYVTFKCRRKISIVFTKSSIY